MVSSGGGLGLDVARDTATRINVLFCSDTPDALLKALLE